MKSKNKLSEMKIEPFEFEGLASFEEIDSYEIFREVERNGKKSIKVERRKAKSKDKKQKEKVKQETKTISDEAEKENEVKKKESEVKKKESEVKKKENEGKKKKNKAKKKENEVKKKENEGKKEENDVKQSAKRKRDENEETQIKKRKSDSVNVDSWKSIFVPDVVLEAIKELGFIEPTLIQKESIPAAIKGRKDIVGAAETGSGKTLAFMIPIISGILYDRERELEMGINSEEEIVSEDKIEDLEEEMIEEKMEDLEECEEEEFEGDIDEEIEEESEGDCDEEIEEELEEDSSCVKVIDNAKFDFLDDKNETSNHSEGILRALIITPTRELALQVKKHTDAILTKTDIKTAVVIGGLSQEKQIRVLNKRPEIVIGTPGRLWEMIQQENPHLSQLSTIKYLAIDETDRMLEKGHFEELNLILQKINYFTESKNLRQNFIFSATLTLTHQAPKRIGKKKSLQKISIEMKLENFIEMIGVRSKPKIIDITRKFGTAETLSETKVFCEKDEKDVYLYYFMKKFPGRTLIFCNSISCVKRLVNVLTALKCKPQSLHASKLQKQRLQSLEKFTSNSLSVLLATDVAARGIDIPGVKHIIHYEVPPTAETYIHRSGRTARAHQEGLSVLLIGSEEIKKYRQLCVTLNRASDLPSFPIEQETLENVRKRVLLAREIELMQHRSNKKSKDDMWLNKMQKEAGFESDRSSDNDDDEASHRALEKKKGNKALWMKQLELSQLLSRPLISSTFSGRYPTSSGKLVLPQEHLMNSSSEGAIDLLKRKKPEGNILLKVNKVNLQKFDKIKLKKENKRKLKKEKRKRKFKE